MVLGDLWRHPPANRAAEAMAALTALAAALGRRPRPRATMLAGMAKADALRPRRSAKRFAVLMPASLPVMSTNAAARIARIDRGRRFG